MVRTDMSTIDNNGGERNRRGKSHNVRIRDRNVSDNKVKGG